MNAVIKSLKTGKALGKNDIKPEMLKAMNIREGRKFFKKIAPLNYRQNNKTNFETNFGSLPIEMYQQPTLTGQKW